MNDTQKNLIYLLFCAVNGITPDTARVQAMDLEKLYRLAAFHSVSGAVCIALKMAGINDRQFDQSYMKAVRKIIFLDIEREAIFSDFERDGIWYMPLKGAVLKDIYSEIGMREMADNDVLFDGDKRAQVKEIMLARGYEEEYYNITNHDVYRKPPMLTFEFHASLFSERHAEPLYRYYADTRRLLRKDENNGCGYHFSDEDFYIYMTAHEWKHFYSGGTGIRSLLDCYVFCRVKGDILDWAYITKQCGQLAIADFERQRRQLAEKVFASDSPPALTGQEQELLMDYLAVGTFGSFENRMKKELKEQSRAGYILRKAFPSLRQMKLFVPFVGKYPILYPAGIIYRWGCALTTKRSYLRRIIRNVKKYGK